MPKLGPICLLAILIASATAAGAANPTEERAAVIATRYLRLWSSNGLASIQDVPRLYERTVTFYGQTYTHRQLMAEKRRAIKRWPVRHYVHRPGSMRTVCNVRQQTCMARSIIDFVVENPRRGTAKHGSARFHLGISFAGQDPRIFSEGGSPRTRRASTRS